MLGQRGGLREKVKIQENIVLRHPSTETPMQGVHKICIVSVESLCACRVREQLLWTLYSSFSQHDDDLILSSVSVQKIDLLSPC